MTPSARARAGAAAPVPFRVPRLDAGLPALLAGTAAMLLALVVVAGGGVLAPAAAARGTRLVALAGLATAIAVAMPRLRRPRALPDLWAIAAVFAAIFYAGEALVALAVGPSAADAPPPPDRAVQSLLLVAFGLAAAGVAHRWVTAPPDRRRRPPLFARLAATDGRVLVAFVAGLWILRLVGAAHGYVWGWSQSAVRETDAPGSVVIQLSTVLRAGAVLIAVAAVADARRPRRALGVVLLLGELAWAMLLGRRMVAALVVYGVVAFLAVRPRFRARDLAWVAAAAAAIVLVVWPFIWHLRMVGRAAGLDLAPVASRARLLVGEVLPTALATFGWAQIRGDDVYVANVQQRARGADYLTDLEARHDAGVPFMHGALLVTAVRAVVPRVLWPEKDRFAARFGSNIDIVVQRHFGLPEHDDASNFFALGYAEGGALGVALYLAGLGIFLGLCERGARGLESAIAGAVVYGVGVSFAFETETNVVALLSWSRLLLAVAAADWLAGAWFARTAEHGGAPARAR